MGYNLYLHCVECGETGFVSRGQEMVCIRRWASRHPGDAHTKQCSLDNGYETAWFAERPDPETLYLPDDIWPDLIEGPDRG